MLRSTPSATDMPIANGGITSIFDLFADDQGEVVSSAAAGRVVDVGWAVAGVAGESPVV